LWSGLLGEVGADGVSWDLDRKTHPHALYQQVLGSLASAGVLVAVASKNDPDLVETALARDDLVLRRDQIFPVAAGWGRKSDSVRHILESWNIGADAVVFVDDSPMELAEVSSAYPGVECVLFPSRDPAAFWAAMTQLRQLFGKSAVSEEDVLRLESLRTAAAVREQFSPEDQASDDFLRTLKSVVDVRVSKAPSDARCLELINKTNQFNLNGRRLTESDVAHSLAREGAFLLEVGYKDKFGPLGKIAVLLGRRNGRRLEIDAWVLSCRAFSRRIEYKIIGCLFDRFAATDMVFDFAPTERNGPVRDFLEACGASVEDGAARLTHDEFAAVSPPFFGALNEV
jgi:FkbH-like protein